MHIDNALMPTPEANLTDEFDISQRVVGWYLLNSFRSSSSNQLLDTIQNFVERQQPDVVGLEEPPRAGDCRSRRALRLARRGALDAVLRGFDSPLQVGDALEDNVAFAVREFELDDVDAQILTLVLRADRYAMLDAFANEVGTALISSSMTIACLLAMDPKEVHARIKPEAPLINQGLITLDTGARSTFGPDGYVRLSGSLSRVMQRPYKDQAAWIHAIVGPSACTALQIVDFKHVGPAVDLAVSILRGAASANSKGIHILLHGPVGTGKTELAKALATASGGGLWSICEECEGGEEPTRPERLASLRLTQRLLSAREGSVVLVDEAEDILEAPAASGYRPKGSFKVYLNRQLENSRRPIIWCCNNPENIDPAILRRMTLAIEVKRPNSAVREEIWRKVAGDMKVALPDDAAKRLAHR